MPMPLPFRPITGAVVAISVATGLATGIAAGGILLLVAAAARRA